MPTTTPKEPRDLVLFAETYPATGAKIAPPSYTGVVGWKIAAVTFAPPSDIVVIWQGTVAKS